MECCGKNMLVPPRFGCQARHKKHISKKKFKKPKWQKYSWKKRRYPYFKRNRNFRPFFRKRGRWGNIIIIKNTQKPLELQEKQKPKPASQIKKTVDVGIVTKTDIMQMNALKRNPHRGKNYSKQ